MTRSNASLRSLICFNLSCLILFHKSTNSSLFDCLASSIYLSIVSYKKSASLPRADRISYVVLSKPVG